MDLRIEDALDRLDTLYTVEVVDFTQREQTFLFLLRGQKGKQTCLGNVTSQKVRVGFIPPRRRP